jgi:hypothetical protein
VINLELRTPWNDGFFQWLTPIEMNAGRRRSYKVYRFPGHRLEFAYDEVINHHLMARRKLSGKRLLEGFLLGIGGLMPAELRHGQRIDIPLVITGADNVEHTEILDLWTDRLVPRPEVAKVRESLFAKSKRQDSTRRKNVSDMAPPNKRQPSTGGAERLKAYLSPHSTEPPRELQKLRKAFAETSKELLASGPTHSSTH